MRVSCLVIQLLSIAGRKAVYHRARARSMKEDPSLSVYSVALWALIFSQTPYISLSFICPLSLSRTLSHTLSSLSLALSWSGWSDEDLFMYYIHSPDSCQPRLILSDGWQPLCLANSQLLATVHTETLTQQQGLGPSPLDYKLLNCARFRKTHLEYRKRLNSELQKYWD